MGIQQRKHTVEQIDGTNGTKITYTMPYLVQRGKPSVVHGTARGHYDNGQLAWVAHYVNDRHHGVEKSYTYDGLLSGVSLWVRGVLRNDLLNEDNRLTRLALLGGVKRYDKVE